MILLDLFISFTKVGVFAYGGGPSMIPLVQEEVVDVHGWMSIEEFTDALAMGYALPGPIATKMAAYIGYKIAHIPGLIVAILGTVLPSLLMMMLLAVFFWTYKDSPYVQATLKAVRPAVVGLLFVVVWEMFPKSVTSWHTGLIAVITFAAITLLSVHPAVAIVVSAIVGVVAYR
ncbi:TPA: chromate transporter [Candidatus Latescibacteria bacterium]|nr:chromate transporter [Candidatus Latescibacterota bacterium]|tara:strand:+ start:102 stop:623 length:522 start_codon:yes stop_codon:yes gene_type:complete